MSNLKILFVASEASPYAKTGGLADVAESLPKTLSAMGHEVVVVIPKYRFVEQNTQYIADFSIMIGSRKETCILRKPNVANTDENTNLQIYFLDNYHYFDRDGLYGYWDDGERFAFFCRGAIDMLPIIGFKPDIIHCNDWHAAPICMILNESYRHVDFYSEIATVYTIHNIQFQGIFPPDIIPLYGVGYSVFNSGKAEQNGLFNCTKSALEYADIINTVSDAYSKEIQTHEFSYGLDGILRSRSNDVYGILNGISYDIYNPMTDNEIYKNYGIDTIENKNKNKIALQEELRLTGKGVPVMGIITRLTYQKGIDLLLQVLEQILWRDIRVVVIGAGDWHYENSLKYLAQRYPDKFYLHLGYNEKLAHKVYAGSDMLLMPSNFEPCGLSQLIALRYGTVPIVRATGGLLDTIVDIKENPKNGNGFRFYGFCGEELASAINRALEMYYNHPSEWKELIKKGLKCDFSWNKTAGKYIELYKTALRKRQIFMKGTVDVQD